MFLSAIAAILMSGPVSAKDVIRIHGATTTVAAIVGPHRDEVEQALGVELKINGNGTGYGLVDLHYGRADLIMTAEPLGVALEAAEIAGESLKAGDYRMFQIDEQEIQFIVHPTNPVSEITWAQARDIHLGKIRNWNQLGGPDKEIIVYIDAPAGGTRAMVKHIILNGQEYSALCRPLDNAMRIAENVAVSPFSIGLVGSTFVDSARMKVLASKKFLRPMGFITKGEPTPQILRVIEAYRRTIRPGA